MALREIGAKLTLEGEAEWRREMKAADRELKNLKSQLAASTAEFSGQEDSIEALQKKYKIQNDMVEQQEEKVKALKAAVKESSTVYGEASQKADSLTQSYNYAQAALSRMKSELGLTKTALEQAETPTDEAASSTQDLADASGEAATNSGGLLENLAGMAGLDLTGIAKGLSVAGVVTGVAGAFKKAYDWAEKLVTETADVRDALTKLDLKAGESGLAMDTDFTRYILEANRSCGDLEESIGTVGSLVTAGYEGDDLLRILQELSGAVAEFPDSLNIATLANDLQKTLATGNAEGQFKEMLERLGADVGDFNTTLDGLGSTAERQNYVFETLSKYGLTDLAKKYREAQGASVDLADADARLALAEADLGGALEPLVAAVHNAKAEFYEFAATSVDMASDVIDAAARAADLGASWNEILRLQENMNNSGFPMTMYELLDVIDWGSAGEGLDAIAQNASDAGVSLEFFIGQLAVMKSQQAWEDIQQQAAAAQALADSEAAAAQAEAARQAAMANASATTETALEKLEQLRQKYDAIRSSIDSAVSGFTDFSALLNGNGEIEGSVEGAQSAMDALQSQIDYLASYQENLQTASGWGLSAALIEELSDGSTESAQLLADIVAAGEQSVQDFNTKFAEVEQGKEAFVETVASVLPEFEETLATIESDLSSAVDTWNMYGDAYLSADQTMQGYIDGINGRLEELRALGAAVSEAVHSAYTEADEQHSPSARAYREMTLTMAGFEAAARDSMSALKALGAEISESFYSGIDLTALQAQITASARPVLGSMGHTISTARDPGTGEVVALLRTWLPEIRRLANMTIVTETGALIGATAAGMDEALGARSASAGRRLAR